MPMPLIRRPITKIPAQSGSRRSRSRHPPRGPIARGIIAAPAAGGGEARLAVETRALPRCRRPLPETSGARRGDEPPRRLHCTSARARPERREPGCVPSERISLSPATARTRMKACPPSGASARSANVKASSRKTENAASSQACSKHCACSRASSAASLGDAVRMAIAVMASAPGSFASGGRR